MDRPEGRLDTIGTADEVARVEAARVEAMLKAMRLGGSLEDLLLKLVDDAAVPWAQFERQEMQAPDGRSQFVHVPRLSALQMAAIDPGLARFLGFADRIDDFPDLELGRGWDTLAVIGLFALEPREFERRGVDLAGLLHQPAAGTDELIDVLARALAASGGGDPRSEIEEIVALVREHGLVAAPFVTVIAPVPPWLPPSLPEPDIIQHRWQATTDNLPSAFYRASFSFPHAPLASMCAVAVHRDGNWISRHDTVDVNGFQPPRRAKPQIFGHEQEAGSRLRELARPSSVFRRRCCPIRTSPRLRAPFSTASGPPICSGGSATRSTSRSSRRAARRHRRRSCGSILSGPPSILPRPTGSRLAS